MDNHFNLNYTNHDLLFLWEIIFIKYEVLIDKFKLIKYWNVSLV